MLESINQRFVQELLKVARRDICKNAGNLVTAPSQAVLDLIVPALQDCFGRETILVVKDDKDAQLHQHRERVDSKLTSILVLLQDEAEGLNLPGDYCKTLLFTRPDNFARHQPVAIFKHIRPSLPRFCFKDFAGFPKPLRSNPMSLNDNRDGA